MLAPKVTKLFVFHTYLVADIWRLTATSCFLWHARFPLDLSDSALSASSISPASQPPSRESDIKRSFHFSPQLRLEILNGPGSWFPASLIRHPWPQCLAVDSTHARFLPAFQNGALCLKWQIGLRLGAASKHFHFRTLKRAYLGHVGNQLPFN